MNTWQPTAPIKNLKKRARIIAKIRSFFVKRNVLEVETPLLSPFTVTDVHLHSLKVHCKNIGDLYLQTSPEYAMKRLLAAGSGSIYQICKAFRDDEFGRLHNPEFTMLEWYRIGFDHHQLMDEMDDFLQFILSCTHSRRYSYQEVFEKFLQINPHAVTIKELQACAHQHNIKIDIDNKDTWLQLLMSEVIEPNLKGIVFVYDYPASQAALAKLSSKRTAWISDYQAGSGMTQCCYSRESENSECLIAERFEVYVDGVELANGFHELLDEKEQRQRFLHDLAKREQLNYPQVSIDENLLAALGHGMPACAGVALGVDRLIMLSLGVDNIDQVIC